MNIFRKGYGDVIIEKRRKNYLYLKTMFDLEEISEISLIFKGLDGKDIPYFLPLKTSFDVHNIVDRLRMAGIPVITWPALGERFENYPSVERIRIHFIFFPLHENIMEGHLEYMVNALKNKIALFRP